MKKSMHLAYALSFLLASQAYAGGEGAEDVDQETTEVVQQEAAKDEPEVVEQSTQVEEEQPQVVEEQPTAEAEIIPIDDEIDKPIVRVPKTERDVIPEIDEVKCYEACKHVDRRDVCEENCPKQKPVKTKQEVYEHESTSITDRAPQIEPPQQLEQEIQVSVDSCEKDITQNNLGIVPYNLESSDSVVSGQFARRDYSGVINNAGDPDHTTVEDLLVLGASYGELEQYDAAIDVFNYILSEKDPKNQLALVNRGVTYEKAKNYTLALRDYDLALKLGRNLKSEYAAIGAGRIYYNLGKYNESSNYYKIAAKIKPNNELTHYMLGLTSAKAKNWSEALYQIRELQQLESPYVADLQKIVRYYQPRVF